MRLPFYALTAADSAGWRCLAAVACVEVAAGRRWSATDAPSVHDGDESFSFGSQLFSVCVDTAKRNWSLLTFTIHSKQFCICNILYKMHLRRRCKSQYGSQKSLRFSLFLAIFCLVLTAVTSKALTCNHFHTSWHLNAFRKTIERQFRNTILKEKKYLLREISLRIRVSDCFARCFDAIHKFNHFNFNLNERDYKHNSLKVTNSKI